MEIDELKVWLETILEKDIERIEQRLRGMDEALKVHESTLSRRLDDLNHFVQKVAEDRLQFLQRSVFDEFKKSLDGRLNNVFLRIDGVNASVVAVNQQLASASGSKAASAWFLQPLIGVVTGVVISVIAALIWRVLNR